MLVEPPGAVLGCPPVPRIVGFPLFRGIAVARASASAEAKGEFPLSFEFPLPPKFILVDFIKQ